MCEVLLIELVRPRKRTMPGRWLSAIREAVLHYVCEGSNCASYDSSVLLEEILFGELLV